MKRRIITIFLALFCAALFANNVSNGVINFELASSGKKIIRLSGDWEFFKGQTFSTLSSSHLKVDSIQVPGSWTGSPDSNVLPYGCNTYRLLIRGLRPNIEYSIFSRTTPALATRIFANGKFIATYGSFSRHEKDYKAIQHPMLCSFPSDKDGTIELVIQVANFDQYKGGILSPIMFGLKKDISALCTGVLLVISVTIGMITFILLTNFLIWIFDKKHIQALYFSLFLLILLLRIVVGDFNALSFLFKTVPYGLQIKLENMILLSFGFFALVYRLENFFTIKHPKLDKTISYISLAFAVLLLCLPVKLISLISSILFVISALFFVYSIYRFALSLKVRNYYVAIYNLFYFIIFSGIILDAFFDGPRNDMLFSYTEISTLILIGVVIVYLAVYLEFLVRDYLNQKTTLSKRYIAYRKFVPSELPHILNRESFGKIELGDNAEFNAIIMVISITVVPPDKTQISLREQFETMAFYSSKIVETIKEYSGTVFSITGNGITALFKDTASTNDALSAACEIRELLLLMNERRIQDYYPHATFNIALHCGSLLLGVIGWEQRIGNTIISPNIELAESISTLAKQKDIPIILSETVVSNLEEFDMSMLRPLGRIKFRELSHPINLYGVISFKDLESPAKLEVPRAITQRDADKYIDL